MSTLSCFKAYDIRGRIPDQLNDRIAFCIGRALALHLNAETLVVGQDIRLSSPMLSDALSQGIISTGANVLHIGVCGTEEVYFATSHLQADGGVCITASHNPMDYNGMKLVRSESRPISGDTGLDAIHEQTVAELNRLAEHSGPMEALALGYDSPGKIRTVNPRADLVQHLLSYVRPSDMKPLRVVCNPGNGGAGLLIDALEPHLPIHWVKIHHEPDGHFPQGVPNPLLIENRQSTAEAVIQHQADFGLAWDGDFDRCFFFDHKGRFIEGYYIVGLLAEAFLRKEPGAKIIHDPRLIWNTQDIVHANKGGRPIESKTGHAFIKERMRQEDAIYGGEMSAHHYFRDFFYCDSGMIPWLLIAQLISDSERSLADMLDERMHLFPVSGEINVEVANPKKVLDQLVDVYQPQALGVSWIDGVSLDMGQWRFNVRMSNTEPLMRLNLETRGDETLMKAKTQEILSWLEKHKD